LFFLAAAQVKEKIKPETARKGKRMKLEDIKTRTKDAVDYLVQSLESGHSGVLAQYLGAIARFHTYSFGNVMLIARQRAMTCCYTSLESMNMRSCALLGASDGA
jgi:DNA-binding phage protein